MGLAFLCGVTRRGPSWVVAARLSGPDMECRGELHYMEVRHAGDMPLEGLVECKTPILLDASAESGTPMAATC